MSDLIERQAAIDAIEEVDWYHQNKNKDMVSGANSSEHQAWYRAEDIYQALERQPTVDAVEVVRCKDCKYYDGECPYPVCNYHEGNVNETDFCAWGERKENEQSDS